ncbi:MAG: hypothetical protein QOJ73_6025, partial [Streptosporangiaceae bacterium]|nr:hypothetical protein [Streptosporangiaceae bacterium]
MGGLDRLIALAGSVTNCHTRCVADLDQFRVRR